MVPGLVCGRLLRVIAREKSHRTRKRHAPGVARRIVAASNQSVARRSSQQPAASVSIHGLWVQGNLGTDTELLKPKQFGVCPRITLRVRDIAAAGADGCAGADANAYGMIVTVVGAWCVISESVLV